MPSEGDAPRRLHPASIFFGLAGYIRAFAVPALLLFFGAGSRDEAWRLWGAALVIPALAASIARYLSFTYTYANDELIVRSGIVFRKERHIPYSRIQNIDAAQNLLQRLFGVFAVTLDTGSGAEAEATLSVLPESALTEMRARVFRDRAAGARGEAVEHPGATDAPVPAPAPAPSRVLLRLGLGDLALCGFIRGRGLLVLGAIVGALMEFGFDDDLDEFIEETAAPATSHRRSVRAVRSVLNAFAFDVVQVLVALALFAVLVLLLRLASMIYTMQRLHGFTLTLARGELHMEFGLLTRVRATVPLRRIQTVTIREGPLHRLFRVSSLRADTAGGGPQPDQAAGVRQPFLAPIIARASLPALLETIVPGAGIDAVEWQRPHGRALRRAFIRKTVLPLAAAVALAWYTAGLAMPALVAGLALALLFAHRQVRHMGHAVSGDYFLYKSGWIWRHVTAAPLAKVQSVALAESPFDRRHGMAALIVDTAGAAGAPHRLHVPWLDRARAETLAGLLAARAAQSSLRW